MKFPFAGWRAWALAAMAALGACSPGTDDASLEVAAELRALRLAMQQARPELAADKGHVAEALSPLREVLDRLVAEQKDLHTRQLTLTEELHRWSQLLAQQVTGQPRADSEALTARLAQLEAALQAQDARHREVEALLGGALDRTADRLEDFLQRLQGKAGQPNGVAPGAPKAEGGSADPKGTDAAPVDPKVGAVEAGARARRQAANGWWIAVLSAAALVGLGFAWRLRRSAAAEFARADEVPGPDRGVEEIWAAAAMLGEAVGRLRETASGQESEPEAPPALGPGDLPDDDVFVLDDDVPDELGAAVAVAPGNQEAVAGPRPVSLHLRTGDPARAIDAVQRVLGDDPRVLRRPAPEVLRQGDGLRVHFAVLPSLAAGQRAHVEQRVRDAACGTAVG